VLPRLARPFEYEAPRSLGEALDLLRRWGPDARLLAGGTDLLVSMHERGLTPACLIDLKRIPDLDEIDVLPGGDVRLGPLVTVRTLERSPIVHERLPVLAEAARLIGSVQIRNLATLGGNLCNASPSADLAPPLLVLDASVEITGTGGSKRVPLSKFFTGPGRTVLNGAILTAVWVPAPPLGTRAVYLKHTPRQAMDVAGPGVAVYVHLEAGSAKCVEVRIAMGGVAPTPLRAAQAEAVLRGKNVTPERIETAAATAVGEIHRYAGDAVDQRSSGRRFSREYRRAMVKVLTRRALAQICR